MYLIWSVQMGRQTEKPKPSNLHKQHAIVIIRDMTVPHDLSVTLYWAEISSEVKCDATRSSVRQYRLAGYFSNRCARNVGPYHLMVECFVGHSRMTTICIRDLKQFHHPEPGFIAPLVTWSFEWKTQTITQNVKTHRFDWSILKTVDIVPARLEQVDTWTQNRSEYELV